MEDLKWEKSTLGQKVTTSEERLEKMTIEFTDKNEKSKCLILELQGKLADAAVQLNNLKQELQQAQCQLEIGGDTVDSLQQTLSEAEQKKTNLEQQCQTLTSQLAELSKSDCALKDEMETLNGTTLSQEKTIETLKQEKFVNNDKFEAALSEKQLAMKILEDECSSSKKEITTLQSILAEKEKSIQSFEIEALNYASKMVQLDQSYKDLRNEQLKHESDYAKLSEDCENATTQLMKSVKSVEELNTELSHTKNDLQVANDKITALGEERNTLISKANEMVSGIERLSQKNEDLKSESDEHLEMLAMCRKEYGDKLYETEVELNRVKESFDTAQSKLNELSSAVKSKDKELAESVQKLEELKTSYEQLKCFQAEEGERNLASTHESTQTITELQQQTNTLQQVNDKLSHDLSEAHELAAKLEEKNETSISLLEQKVKELKEEATFQRQMTQEKQGENSQIQQQLLSQGEVINNFEAKLASLKESHAKESNNILQDQTALQKLYDEKTNTIAELEKKARDLQELNTMSDIKSKQDLSELSKELEVLQHKLDDEKMTHEAKLNGLKDTHEFAINNLSEEKRIIQNSLTKLQECAGTNEKQSHCDKQKLEGEIHKFQLDLEQAQNVQSGLRDHISDIEAQLNVSRTELEKKGSEVCRLEDKIVSVEQDLIAKAQSLEGLMNERDGIMAENQALTDRLSVAEEKIETKDKEMGSLSQQLVQQNESSQAQNTDLGETVQQYKLQLDGLTTVNDGITKSNGLLKDQIDELISSQTDLTNTNAVLKLTLNDVQSKVERLELDMAQQQEEHTKLILEKSDMISCLRATQDSLKCDLQANEDELTNRIESLGSVEQELLSNKEYTHVLEKKMSDNVELHAKEVETLNLKIGNLKQDIQSVTQQLEVKDNEERECNMKFEALRLQLEESIKTQKLANIELQTKSTEHETIFESQLQGAKEEMMELKEAMNEEKTKLIHECDTLKEKLQKAQDSIEKQACDTQATSATMKNALSDLQNINAGFQEQIAELQRNILVKEEDLATKSNQYLSLEEKLLVVKVTISSLNSELEVSKDKEILLTKDLTHAQSVCEDLQKKLASKEEVIFSNTSTVADLNQQVTALTDLAETGKREREEISASLSMDISMLEEKLEMLTAQNQELNSSVSDNKETVLVFEQKIKDLENNITLVTGEKSALEKELQRLVEDNEVVKHLESDLSKLRQVTNEKQTVIDHRVDEVHSLSKELLETKEKLTAIEHKTGSDAENFESLKKNMELSISTLETNLIDCRSQIDNLQSECKVQEQKIEVLNTEKSEAVKNYSSDMSELKKQLADCKIDFEQKMSSLQSENNLLEQFKQEAEAQHQSILENMQSQITELSNEVTLVTEKKESELSALQMVLTGTKDTCGEYTIKITELGREITGLSDEISKYQQEHKTLESNRISLEREIVQLKYLNEELSASVSSESNTKSDMEADYNELKCHLESKVAALESANMQINTMRNEIKDQDLFMQEERGKMQRALDDNEHLFREEVEKNHTLTDSIRDLERNLVNKEKRVNDLDIKKSSLEDGLSAVTYEKELLVSQLQQTASQISSSEQKYEMILSDLKDTNCMLEKQLENYLEQCEHMKHENKDLVSKKLVLENTVKELEQENMALCNDLDIFKEYDDRIKSQLRVTQSSMGPTQTYDSEDVLSQIQGFESEHQSLKVTIAGLQSEKSDLKDEMKNLADLLCNAETKYSTSETELAKLSEERDNILSDISEKQMEVAAQQSEKHELECTVNTLKVEITMKVTEIEELLKSVNEYNKSTTQLEGQLEQEQSTNKTFAFELEDARKQISALTPAIISLEENVILTERKNADQAQEVEELQQSLHAARTESLAKDVCNGDLENDIKVLKTAVNDFKMEKQQLADQIVQHTTIVASQKETVQELEKTLSIKTDQLENQSQEVSSLKRKLSELTNHVQKVENSEKSMHDSFQKEIEILKRDKIILEELVHTMEEEKLSLCSNLDIFSQELNSVQQRCKLSSKYSSQLDVAEIDIKGQLSILQEEILALQAEKEELRVQNKQVEDLKESNMLLENRLSEQITEGDAVSTNMLDLKAKLVRLNADNDSLNVKVSEKEKKLKMLEVEKESLEVQMQKRKEEHATLFQQYSETDQSLINTKAELSRLLSMQGDTSSQESIGAVQLELGTLQAEKKDLLNQVTEQKKDLDHLESKVKMLYIQLQQKNKEAETLNKTLEGFSKSETSSSNNSDLQVSLSVRKTSENSKPIPGTKVTQYKTRAKPATRGSKAALDRSRTDVTVFRGETSQETSVSGANRNTSTLPTVSDVLSPRDRFTTRRRLSDRLRKKSESEMSKTTLDVPTHAKRPSDQGEGNDKEAKKPRIPIGDFKTPGKCSSFTSLE